MKLSLRSTLVAVGLLGLVACSTTDAAETPITLLPDGALPDGAPPPDGGADGSVTCPAARSRCAVDFEYAVNADAAVELRGDWEPTKWTAGERMTSYGATWKRTVYLPPGQRVEYKYCLDPNPDGTCVMWEADPSKPTTGSGATTNNVIDVKCDAPVCAPESGIIDRPVRFIAVGDTGEVGTNDVSAAMAAKCQASGCDFVLLLGDNVYDDGVTSPTDPQLTTKFENRFAAVHAPFHVILGNHDYGGNGAGTEFAKAQHEVDYTQRSKKWRMPSRYYRLARENVDFFALDTNAQMYALDAQQKIDVKGWVAASKAEWRIAFGHHPYLSNGPHGNAGVYDGTPNDPVFGGGRVKSFADEVYCGSADLYLSGHDHSRQWMTDTCKGTELAVSGAGAKVTTLPGKNAARFKSTAMGFLYVTIDGKKLTAEFMTKAGVDFTHVLTKP